ncbi:DNA gyrase subunit A [Acidaminobacter hydrogenoformans]|uniref:DNA gyrase subunit A n=1 Tax=Acidaminobacter hydrogenoformans DSM 2784 TaxID=1120920 RepID=A0A1G5RT96_9FIRM|nr:DNA gyrase subunit A [Acidaminobacter hydrogenoformans]SCZ76671.1 DNA gyrase subunit A [Acidaminobacter hydrogenoformans DSM 2784]
MDNEIQRVVNMDISKEMKKSYIDYAMSVIVSRALPDVRDGLKPVHRRILFDMHELSFGPDKPYRKSARIVGDVLGKFHPHGDSSVYNAMVRMAQDFAIRYQLIDGHGNFGSIDGDSAAAMRYTEARMSKIATELLKDIDKETIDYRPNFDETLQEPVVLPSRFPNLLVNGSNGIAVGMATAIPPHNLSEIIDATLAIIDDADIDIEDLIDIVRGPDFPTGAQIMGSEGIKRGYRTGRGKVIVRAKASIEEIRKDKTAILISEIPYQVNKSKMLEDIANLVRDKKIDGITDLRDESNREGIRVVVELRRDANANVVLNQLYKHTQLQSTFGVNMIALVEGEPKLLNLKQVLHYYVLHQKDVETRRVQYDLRKAEERAHVLEGLMIALNNIDDMIELIKAAPNPPQAKVSLIEKYALSEIQAQAILDMRLQRLTGLERDKIENEYKEIIALIKTLQEILADEVLLFDIIRKDLLRIKEKYGDPRRTEITINYDEIDIEDMIEDEDVVITLTHSNYIKRTPVDTYAAQKRGGRGKTGVTTKEEDFVENIYTTRTHDYLLFFTNFGKVYRLKAYQIPESGRVARGTAVVNLIQLDPEEVVTAVIPIKSFESGYLMLMTKKGIVKRTALNKFDTSRKNGLIAIHLNSDDELISVRETSGADEVIVITSHGMSVRFNENDVREMGRVATGVRGIRLGPDDEVVCMEIILPDGKLLIVSENGYGKRTELDEYRIQTRGGKGIKTYNMNSKTGKVVSARVVKDDEEIMLINSQGVLIRLHVDDISVLGRSTSGVRLMKTDETCCVVSTARIVDKPSEEDE